MPEQAHVTSEEGVGELSPKPILTLDEWLDRRHLVDGPGYLIKSRGSVRPHYVFWTRSDREHAVTMTGRALLNLGVRPGAHVVIQLANPHHAVIVADSAVELGAQTTILSHGDEAPDLRPTVLVTDPFSAVAWTARHPSDDLALIILTESVGAVDGLKRKIINQVGPSLSIRQLYSLIEVPGPLAIDCPKGNLHWTAEGVTVELLDLVSGNPADIGQPAMVVVTDTRERVASLARFFTGDLARVQRCACGWGSEDGAGPVTSEILGRSPVPQINARPIYPADLIAALYRTPGFSGRATAEIVYDRGRGVDYLAIHAGVDPGWDTVKVLDAIHYSVEARLKTAPRIEVDTAGGLPGVFLRDDRA